MLDSCCTFQLSSQYANDPDIGMFGAREIRITALRALNHFVPTV